MPSKPTRRGKTWHLHIRKVRKKWVVDTPGDKIYRGRDAIEWTLDPLKGKPKAVSAYFQFTQKDLFEGYANRRDLTRDLTAVIRRPGGKLKLKVKKNACRRKNPRYYAVWIRDATHKNGGQFAVGAAGNPPPEMEVGP